MTQEITFDLARSLVPPRPEDGHKGTFGHLAIIAGARGFTGAPRLAALAACRAGTGLVSIGAPDAVADLINLGVMEAMCHALPSTDAGAIAHAAVQPALKFVATKSAVALGPGITQQPETMQFVLDFVRANGKPIVIDADGLNALATSPKTIAAIAAPCVLTPHPGEMARLTGLDTATVQGSREETAAKFAAEHGCSLVLKGYRTLVAQSDGSLFINVTGSVALASGGTGDVLTGIIGSLLAQGLTPLDAARLGVFVHGLAGDLAAQEKSPRGLIASDVIHALPKAWRVLEEGRR
jgi:NAD(P)H-hydrate epimerase